MRIRSIATLLGAFTLTACADNTWQKPIALSPRVQSAYDVYTKLPAPGEFAVSEDGQSYGYTYCQSVSTAGCRNRGARSHAIRNCEIRSGGVECKIYAIGVGQVYTGQ